MPKNLFSKSENFCSDPTENSEISYKKMTISFLWTCRVQFWELCRKLFCLKLIKKLRNELFFQKKFYFPNCSSGEVECSSINLAQKNSLNTPQLFARCIETIYDLLNFLPSKWSSARVEYSSENTAKVFSLIFSVRFLFFFLDRNLITQLN